MKPGDPQFAQKLAATSQDSAIWGMASVFAAQSIIRPEETRDYLIRMFDVYKLRMTRGVGQHLMRSWPTSY